MDKPKLPSAEYEIGYRKPPKATQFKKGTSGNPKGRPKGSVNLAALVRRVFERKVTIQQNGRMRKVTVSEAMLTRLIGKAITGDNAAMRLSIGLLQATDVEAGPAPTLFDSEEDRALLREVLGDWNRDPNPELELPKSKSSRTRKGGHRDENL